MTIVFRLNYRTIPGESLWIRLSASVDGQEVMVAQWLPMNWINSEQWELRHELKSGRRVRLSYHYQYRKEGYGLELDEWGTERIAETDAHGVDSLWIRDTWRSAGTIGYAYETKAFPNHPVALDSATLTGGLLPSDHQIRMHCAAVPDGCCLCVLGEIEELGAWDGSRAVAMHKIAPNDWVVRVSVPLDRPIEYKYGWMDRHTGMVIDLEQGENRRLEAHALGGRQCSWIHDQGYRRRDETLFRAAGVAIPVFSLRSERSLGVGEFADLVGLSDWCRMVGLRMIQILPVNDTTSAHDWTDSYPYSAISVFALHPMFLRIEDMGCPLTAAELAELDQERNRLNALPAIDYEQVMVVKRRLTRSVFRRCSESIEADAGWREFLDRNRTWLVPYAAFCVLRDRFGTADFSRWGEWAAFDASMVAALMDNAGPERDEMHYHIWLQAELHQQLSKASACLHERGVVLKGDLPIGIDRQSVDAWVAPDQFNMEAQAGAPPDAFSEKGQNWGFPTYDWEAMRADGYAWWQSRFAHLSQYFDAFRIDHILGFFRIWQVPMDQIEGIMGWFDPAIPVRIDEFRERRIEMDVERFCRPHIPARVLPERFGEHADAVAARYLVLREDGTYRLRDEVSTQRKIAEHFASVVDFGDPETIGRIRQGLFDCVSDVLFFEVPGSGGTEFHPRFFLQKTTSFADLDDRLKERVDGLYVDYFFRRQDGFWKASGYRKLPAMRRASPMLLCGEDLGLVPDCVPDVLRELGILSLEIQRMPKSLDREFGNPAEAPYLSVVSPSTHDMPTLRAWWTENPRLTSLFAWQQLAEAYPPDQLTGALADRILRQLMQSPAMWVVVPLQDLLAIDESLRHPDPSAERINVPAIMPYYWRYRMHLTVERLRQAGEFNRRVVELLAAGGR